MPKAMKILIYSRAFRPSVGGLELMMEILAEEFVGAGHHVRVVTQTGDDACDDNAYEIARLPSFRSYMQLLRWCDVCLFASLSLRGLWPAILAKKPIVLSHQTAY